MRVSAKDVLRDVAHANGMDVTTITDRSTRLRNVAWPRQDAMREIFARCPHMSLPAIGSMFGMDHTTARYGIIRSAERAGLTYDDIKSLRELSRGPSYSYGWQLIKEPSVFQAAMQKYGEVMGRKAA